MIKLETIDGKLAITALADKAITPFYVDFTDNATNYRRQHSSGRSEAIARAIGINKLPKPINIIDATAGLGRDSFILASLGCTVKMIERNPIVVQLLADALKQGLNCPEIFASLQRMTLIPGEALTILKNLPANGYPEVIYLDPMFPENKKTAKAKLAMQLLREITTIENVADSLEYNIELFELACKIAKKRVVIKRHKTNQPLIEHKPSFSITGKTVRFDVYNII